MASIIPESQIRELEQGKCCDGNYKIFKYSGVIDLVLRVNLFVTTLAPVILLATSKQTVFVKTPSAPYGASVSAKLTDLPSLTYAIATLSVACLYSIITTLVSFWALRKQAAPSIKLMFSIYVMDVLVLGLVAAGAGAAGDAGYIGLRGNKHTRWQKLCTVFDTFCFHVGFSLISSCAAGIILMFLVVLYIFKLSARNYSS